MLSSSSSAERSEADLSACSARFVSWLHLLLHLVDCDCDLLEELVDFVGVVASEAVTKLDFPKDF